MYFVKFVKRLAAESGDPVYGSEIYQIFKGNRNNTSSCFNTTSGRITNAGNKGRCQNHNRRQNHTQFCVLCKEEHKFAEFDKFKSMSASDRLNVVKSNKLCFNCLRSLHFVSQCKDPIKCSVCGRKHARLIHIDCSNNRARVSDESNVTDVTRDNVTVTSANALGSAVYQPIMHAVVNGVPVLGLLDTGSTNTFMTESLAARLQLKGKNHSFIMHTVHDCKHVESVSATLSNSEGSFAQDVTNVLVVPNIPARYPSVKIDVEKFPHSQFLVIPDISSNSQVDLLIGMDNSDILIPLEGEVS